MNTRMNHAEAADTTSFSSAQFFFSPSRRTLEILAKVKRKMEGGVEES